VHLPIAIIALVVVVVAAGLLTVPSLFRPAVVTPPVMPLMVTANQAGGEGVAHVGYPVPITAHALGGTAIRGIEMWLGGERIAQSLSSNDSPAFHARWSWTPKLAGEATLVARAIDVDGRVAQSNLVRIHVSADPPSMVDLQEVVASEGETLTTIAAREGADPTRIGRWNDDLDPLAALTAGTVVLVPIPIPAPPPPADDFDEMIELAADIEPVFAPPSLTTTVTGCLVDVAVSGGSTEADGFAVYQADPSSLVFANVKTSAATGGSGYQTEAVSGTYVFSASAFIGSIEVQSDPVVVEIPEGCEGNGWTGDVSIVGGKLLAGQAVDMAYFYASIDGGPFGRVPATPASTSLRTSGSRPARRTSRSTPGAGRARSSSSSARGTGSSTGSAAPSTASGRPSTACTRRRSSPASTTGRRMTCAWRPWSSGRRIASGRPRLPSAVAPTRGRWPGSRRRPSGRAPRR
jgi:hypothetical protein